MILAAPTFIERIGVHTLSLVAALVVGVIARYAFWMMLPTGIEPSNLDGQTLLLAAQRNASLSAVCGVVVFAIMALAGAVYVERRWRSTPSRTDSKASKG